ncbi:hypothetical protein Tsubulata_038001 [Turnera subulata]|uniref:Amino acid transporter transmembrane domain-containing protein n=1 Tax=Turnera subulata TaxID=218843 RepID=A0A9Q0F7D7_9ROSI|nr:hypothetical protein Tsubulata_038001 [Turnera subulata]
MGEVVDSSSIPAATTPKPNSVAPTPPIAAAPPSQFQPSHSLSPLPQLSVADHIEPEDTSKTPRNGTPLFNFAPISGTPVTIALKLTALNNEQDAWLPITQSRKGNAYHAAFHCLCSGIGVQALVLPVSFVFLGWSWGVILMTLAFIWQLYTLYLLVQLHESPETGIRYSRYLHLWTAAFGDKASKWLVILPHIYLSIGTCAALIILGGSTLQTFFYTACGEPCDVKTLTPVEWYLVFACATVVLSQIPNLNSFAVVSLVGAITAVGYCTIIWLVSVAKGTIPGVSYHPLRQHGEIVTVFSILNALGIIAFAFKGHNLILEIQGTMPSSEKHPSRVPMWKGVKFASLTSYQIYAMPIFDELERRVVMKWKNPCPCVSGLLGGISLPVTLAYPCFMWLKIKKPKVRSPMWCLNWIPGVFGLILSAALIASGIFVILHTGIHASFFKPKRPH